MSDRRLEQSPENPGQGVPNRKAYDRSANIARGLFSLVNVTMTSEAEIPDPPFILAATHRGFKDIIALGLSFRDIGRIQFMAKEELFTNRMVGKHLLACGTFPINRENPKPDQLRRAFAVLHHPEDAILGIFPEGGIKHGPNVEMPKSSFAIMALAAQVPVVVAGVAGSELKPKSVAPSGLHSHIGGIINVPKPQTPYTPEMDLMRFGARNKQLVRTLSADTQYLLQTSLDTARREFSPGTSIHFINRLLYPSYS